MNTRVTQGPKPEPPVEVSFSVTPWRRLMGLFIWRHKGVTGTWCRTPFAEESKLVPRFDGFGELLWVGPRSALLAEWLIGVAVASVGGLFAFMAWIVHSRNQPLPGQRPPLDPDFVWLAFGVTGVIGAIFLSAGVWLCVPLVMRIVKGRAQHQRVAVVFGSEREKLSDGRFTDPGLHLSGPEMTAHIPWSHVIGTYIGGAQVWIICLGRRIVDIPLHAKPLPDGRAGLNAIAAKVERAARGEMTEREHLLSLITLGGPKCPRCSYVMRGVSEQCPECGVNVVDVMGSRGQLGSGDLRLMRRLWDTDMPA